MATKERFQNPTGDDSVTLRLFTFNANNPRSVQSIDKVEIYFLDPTEVTDINKDGRRLISTVEAADVTADAEGEYSVEVTLTKILYPIGNYIDIWTATFEDDEYCQAAIENSFQIYPNLWFTTPIPIVYDFNFFFRPNRMASGSKRYIIAEVVPNVPRGSDLVRYYENLAIVSDLKISIEQICGDCVPKESDLRLVVNRESVDYREKRFGYFMLDTTDMDIGLYNVWFELAMGDTVFVSEKNQLQIF